MWKSLIILGLWVFGCLGSSPAASYYVDYVAGSDANNGTATGTPFQRCPGDASATGTAASTTLSAGDTVYFKGGVSYVVTGAGGASSGIALSWSGTAGNPITYDGNSGGSWGTGRAIITDNHAASGHNSFLATATRSNLTFRSLIIKELGGSATLPTDGGSAVAANPGGGINFNAGTAARNIIVRDCDFSEIGYYFNQQPMNEASIQGGGLTFYDGNGIVISNCNFSRQSICVTLLATTVQSNIVVANCVFTDSIRWCLNIASVANNTHTDWITIRSNVFHDYWQFDSGAWTGYGEWPHTDGIFFRQDYTGATYGTNNNFHANSFYSTSAPGGGTADIYLTEGPSANIYNNTWTYSGKGLALVYFYNTYNPSNPQVVNIFNNSFLTTFLPCINISGPGYDLSTFNLKNNIFYDTQTGSGANYLMYWNTTNDLTGVTLDYNLYKTANTSSYLMRWENGGGSYTLTDLRNVNWEDQGLADDPDYTALSDATAPLSANLALQSSSPCIGTGVNLSSYFTTDKNGANRGGAWDMGAIEYVTNSPAAGITTLRVGRLIHRKN